MSSSPAAGPEQNPEQRFASAEVFPYRCLGRSQGGSSGAGRTQPLISDPSKAAADSRRFDDYAVLREGNFLDRAGNAFFLSKEIPEHHAAVLGFDQGNGLQDKVFLFSGPYIGLKITHRYASSCERPAGLAWRRTTTGCL